MLQNLGPARQVSHTFDQIDLRDNSPYGASWIVFDLSASSEAAA
jgi:hypothetical protein